MLAGSFDDTLAFGGAAQPISSAGMLDVWVAKLDASGNGTWAARFGAAGIDREPRIAMNAAGDVYVGGTFSGQVAFGAINLVSQGGEDLFLAKLRGGDGSVAWAVSFGSVGTDQILDVAADAAGHVVVSGDFGGAGTTNVDAFVASFEATTGASRWRHVFATSGDDRSFAATYGRNGDVYALVGLGGAFDFGMPILGPAGPAAVLLRIAP